MFHGLVKINGYSIYSDMDWILSYAIEATPSLDEPKHTVTPLDKLIYDSNTALIHVLI